MGLVGVEQTMEFKDEIKEQLIEHEWTLFFCNTSELILHCSNLIYCLYINIIIIIIINVVTI